MFTSKHKWIFSFTNYGGVRFVCFFKITPQNNTTLNHIFFFLKKSFALHFFNLIFTVALIEYLNESR